MKPEKKFKNKKEETSIPSVSLLINSPIQVLTGPNWLDIESPFMSTFLPLDHSSTKLRHNSHSTRNAANRLDVFDTIILTIPCVVEWCKVLAEGMVWGPASLFTDAFARTQISM